MTNSLEDEIQRLVTSMDTGQNAQDRELPQSEASAQVPGETIHIHYFPDAIVIFKEEEAAHVIDSAPVIPQNISFLPAYVICVFYLFLIFSCIAFQVYEIRNPPIATVTIIPKSQTVTMTGTLQLGRLLNSLTLSQSQTEPTTGKGHQVAKQANGVVTFYNGLFTGQTIAQGTILTGADGIQVITDREAVIPAANPPVFGQATVSAHATSPGTRGNIPAYEINQACCANAVLVKNTTAFTGGQNERDFSTVRQEDIHTVSTAEIPRLRQEMQSALQGQLLPFEQLQLFPCTPTVTSDHRIGQEAPTITVTVSEICSAAAYNTAELDRKATGLLSRLAVTKAGTAYSLFGNIQVRVTQAMTTHTPPPLVFLSFHAQGTWIYALSGATQQQIKSMIAGKTKQEALQILASLPGVERTSISWGDESRLPKNTGYLHITLVIVERGFRN
jgi:Baseplate J-like protein